MNTQGNDTSRGTLRTPYEEMADEARRCGWPDQFESDLICWDRAWCEKRDPSAPFGWILRQTGTHVIAPDWRDGAGHRAEEYPGFVAGAFGEGHCRWYWWNGATLVELRGAEELSELLSAHAPRSGATSRT
jgi:hypothetical protein